MTRNNTLSIIKLESDQPYCLSHDQSLLLALRPPLLVGAKWQQEKKFLHGRTATTFHTENIVWELKFPK